MECGTSSAGRARPCQGRGHEFEPRVPLQLSFYILKSNLLTINTHINPKHLLLIFQFTVRSYF